MERPGNRNEERKTGGRERGARKKCQWVDMRIIVNYNVFKDLKKGV